MQLNDPLNQTEEFFSNDNDIIQAKSYFSSFGLEIFTLLKHHPWIALFDVVIQLVFGLLGVAGGFALGRWLA